MGKVCDCDLLSIPFLPGIDVKYCEMERMHGCQLTRLRIYEIEAKVGRDSGIHVDDPEEILGHPIPLGLCGLIGGRGRDPQVNDVAISRVGHVPDDQDRLAKVRAKTAQITVDVVVPEVEILQVQQGCRFCRNHRHRQRQHDKFDRQHRKLV